MSGNKTIMTPQHYHSYPKPGKIETVPTKPLMTQEDLSLAYTPGVAEVCTEIQHNPEMASKYTSKGNLVAVITNGSAVLGLGNIGALASKPVMEGKGVLFKKFANIDCFDIEIDEADPDAFVDTVARLAPTFGGINLEDIKAPECFEIEEKLKARLDIPVMHDDQHGTAIILTAAFINAIHLTGKKPENIKIVGVGAGAAGLACMKMLSAYGVQSKNITLVDVDGVVYKGRPQMNPYIEEFAREDDGVRTLEQAIEGADMFVGLSAGGVLKPEFLEKMGRRPIVFAMANPHPEIMPDVAKKTRPDAIVGTGRSDFPNQINNVLGFPYLFRGALDCGATTINMEMKIAAAEAIAKLARKEADASVESAYKGQKLRFGEDYLIPKPFDPRLLAAVAPAVAKAAEQTGVAKRPIVDYGHYEAMLNESVDQSFALVRQIFNTARKSPKRVIFPDSEDDRVLKAAQVLVNEGIARPILVGGRPEFIRDRIADLGLPMQEGADFELVDPNSDPRLERFSRIYYDMRKREGLLPPEAAIILRSRWAAFSAMMVREGEADAMVTGITGRFDKFLRVVQEIIGHRPDVSSIYATTLVMHRGKVYFIGDTHVNPDPTAEQIAEMTNMAAKELAHFGMTPRVALLSHGNFGSSKYITATKQQKALKIIRNRYPDLVVEGEMQADAALNMTILHRIFPDAQLDEPANILIMPTIDAANITFNVIRSMHGSSEYIGPILLGLNKPVHILNVNASVRQIVNMSALAVVEAQAMQGEPVHLGTMTEEQEQ